MPRVASDDQAKTKSDSVPQPYAPSWVDHLTSWVSRLPGPRWSYYIGLGLILLLVQGVVLWVEGAFSFPHFDRAHAFLAAAIPYMLAMIHYFDGRAGAALAGMRPALKATEKEYDEILLQLTTLPSGPTLLAGLVAFGCALLLEALGGEPYHLPALDTVRISANLFRFLWLILWWNFGTFVYHTFHQLGLIDRIYTKHTRINLFRMKGLYDFSNLAALTAGSLAVLPIGFMFANPSVDRTDPAMLGTVLVVQFIAVLTFIWPQLGIHRLQIEEKERLRGEANQRLEVTIVDLHQRIDSGNLEGMTDLNMAIASLGTERNVLDNIPTWPWEPEVVRLLITALALPLGLWVIQLLLQSALG